MSILKNACIIVNLERQARDCTAMEKRIVILAFLSATDKAVLFDLSFPFTIA
jgi:hypothetical protein